MFWIHPEYCSQKLNGVPYVAALSQRVETGASDERVDAHFGGSGSSLEMRRRGKCQHLPNHTESFGKHSNYARACVIPNLVHLSTGESVISGVLFTQYS
jgi:hypothetical protein